MSEILPRLILDDEHEFCQATEFCVKCGMHYEMVITEGHLCLHGTNVEAISHRRAFQIALEHALVEDERNSSTPDPADPDELEEWIEGYLAAHRDIKRETGQDRVE